MTQQLTSNELQTALGAAPSAKQNLPELEVGPLTVADIPDVSVSGGSKAVSVVAHDNTSMPSPYLYVPALNEPSHPLKVQGRDGQWFELARTVDLRHFGKVIDNRGSDIGPALRNFVDFAKEKGGGSVEIPPGIFSLESPVDETINLPKDNIGIGIYGQGTEISRIVVDGASVSHGPRFTGTNRAAYFQFERFAILADGIVAGRPLEATLPIGGARRNCSHIVRDLLVQGWDSHRGDGAPQDDHFTHGFNFTGAWRLLYENNHISGPVPPVGVIAYNDWSDSSILWRMEDGLVIDGAYAPIVRDAQFYFIAYPVICLQHPEGYENPPNIGAERGLFDNVRCPTCKLGIKWFREGAEPELVITDCFFDFRDGGVDIKGARLGQVYRNAFFQKTDTDPSRPVPVDIKLDHCLDFFIENNFHHSSGDSRRIAVHLRDTGTEPQQVTTGIEIRHNRLSQIGVIDRYLKKDATVGSVIYEPGAMDGTVVGEVEDASVELDTRLDLREPYELALQAPAGASIPTGGWRPLVWASEPLRSDEQVADALEGPENEKIVIPSDRAITRVQLRVNVVFEADGTGDREIEVLKNGAPADEGLYLSTAAASGTDTALGGLTGWIDVVGGDRILVRARQTSGGSLQTTSRTTLTALFR